MAEVNKKKIYICTAYINSITEVTICVNTLAFFFDTLNTSAFFFDTFGEVNKQIKQRSCDLLPPTFLCELANSMTSFTTISMRLIPQNYLHTLDSSLLDSQTQGYKTRRDAGTTSNKKQDKVENMKNRLIQKVQINGNPDQWCLVVMLLKEVLWDKDKK